MSEFAEAIELVKFIEPSIRDLTEEHRAKREHWYYHELIPWEKGEAFSDKPWDESQATLSPDVRTAFVLNLLTEDNLPYYYAMFQPYFDRDAAVNEWSRLWTAEEGQHSIAMRSYLLTSRNCDPRLLEDERMSVVTAGYHQDFETLIDVFCYTSAQELATRISHRNTGVQSEDEVAYALLAKIAGDENRHYLFYRGVTTALFAQNPDAVVKALNRVLQKFQMPGTGIPGFQRKALGIARAGIYNLRVHVENIINPLVRHWRIANLVDLSPAGAQAQDELMALGPALLKRAEQFEARQARKAS